MSETKPLDNLSLFSRNEVESFVKRIEAAKLTSRKEILELLVTQAAILFEREPWLIFNEQPVYIALDNPENPIIAHFSGGLGTIFGANVYRSEREYDRIFELQDMADGLSDNPEAEAIVTSMYGWASEALWITEEEVLSLAPHIRKELEPYIDKDQRVVVAPIMKNRGYAPWTASDEDLLIGLAGIFGLMEMATTKPTQDGSTIEINLLENGLMKEKFSQAFETFRKRLSLVTEPPDGLGSTEKKLNEALSAAQQTEEIWEIGLIGGLGIVQENPLSKPAMTCAALVVDSSSGIVLGLETFAGNVSPARVAAKALLKALKSTRKRPKIVNLYDSVVAEEMHEKLSMFDISFVTKAPAFEEAAISLMKAMGKEDVVMN